MIALLVVLAVLWLAYVIIDSMGPVGIMLVLGGIVVAFLTMGCATLTDTPAQVRSQARIQRCESHLPSQCQIRRIDADGRVHTMCGSGSNAGWDQWANCMKARP